MIRGQSGACFRVRATGFDGSCLCWVQPPEAARKCTKLPRQLSTNIMMLARGVVVVKVMQTSDRCPVPGLFPFSIFVVPLPARLIYRYDADFQHHTCSARQHKDAVPLPADFPTSFSVSNTTRLSQLSHLLMLSPRTFERGLLGCIIANRPESRLNEPMRKLERRVQFQLPMTYSRYNRMRLLVFVNRPWRWLNSRSARHIKVQMNGVLLPIWSLQTDQSSTQQPSL